MINPYYTKSGSGRRPRPLATILPVHLMQNWFGSLDPAMEEAMSEITRPRQCALLRMTGPIPDETMLLNFRHLQEKHELAPKFLEVVNADLTRMGLRLRRGTMVDATVAARRKLTMKTGFCSLKIDQGVEA